MKLFLYDLDDLHQCRALLSATEMAANALARKRERGPFLRLVPVVKILKFLAIFC
jgi:hypothetical protein